MSEHTNLSREELLFRVQELEAELKRKRKYGLVWEDKVEDVVLECKNKYPVVRSVENKRIRNNTTDPVNVLIEGDNYHALQVLNYTHKGKVDVIYIDPPYNTGNKDFIYNDDFIGDDDGYRHSKWLSFMERRLQLAKELLKDTGVIFISIDDNEQAQLKLLCDGVFGERNFVNNIIWQRASGGGNAKGIVTGHDYVLVYQKSMPVIDFLGDAIDEKRFSKEKVIMQDGKKFYIDDDIVRKVFGKYESGIERRCYYEELSQYKNKKQIDEIEEKIKNKELFLIKQKNGKHFIAKLQSSDERKKLYSIIQGVLNNQGANEMEDFDVHFSYPKPSLLIKKIINSIPNNNALVLDFFAGSGTTGHAVLELNKEDEGNRKFILVTNNGDEKSEHKIAEKITYERLKKVMNGYTNKKGDKIEGLGGNLEYMKCELVEKSIHSDNLKLSVAENSKDVVALKEGTFDTKIEKRDGGRIMYTIMQNFNHSTTASYSSIDDRFVSDFKKELNKISGPKTVYVNSLMDSSHISLGVKNIELQELPEIK